MISYQIIIEGVFIDMDRLVSKKCGFHTTFFVEANNARNAIRRIEPRLRDRMKLYDVRPVELGTFKTYFFVRDMWEITRESYEENSALGSGFGFFNIGRLESFYLLIRYLFFLKFKPWVLLPLE